MMNRFDVVLGAITLVCVSLGATQLIRYLGAADDAVSAARVLATTRTQFDAIASHAAAGQLGGESLPASSIAGAVALSMEDAGVTSSGTPTVSPATQSPSSGRTQRESESVRIDLPPMDEASLGLVLQRLEDRLIGWTCTRVSLRARVERGAGAATYTATLTFVGDGDGG